MKNLLFITTSSLAANPRLVKEFETLKKQYKCFVLCFKHQDWSLELSEAIKKSNPEVAFIEIDRKQEALQTIISKIVHKVAILLNSWFPKQFKVCAFANTDKALQLWFKTRSLQKRLKYSTIIAHNLGAFYAAVKASEQKEIDLQLDIEDYYPGEALYFNKAFEIQNRMRLMAFSFLRADVITYASEGIKIECMKHFEAAIHTKHITIINAFNANDFVKPKAILSENLQCVWFSQHIGPNRGLEEVFETARRLGHVEFHLIGNRNEDYLNASNLSNNIKLYDIMKQEALHEFLSKMDVGLALENVNADLNRDICLTNKFMAYAQAGIYILATGTFGQTHFLNSLNYNAGVMITTSLEDTLGQLDKELLNTHNKIDRWQYAISFSWEKEQLKLKALMS